MASQHMLPSQTSYIQDCLLRYFWIVSTSIDFIPDEEGQNLIEDIMDSIPYTKMRSFHFACKTINDQSYSHNINPFTYLVLNRSLLIKDFNPELYDYSVLLEYCIRMDQKKDEAAETILMGLGKSGIMLTLQKFLEKCSENTTGLTQEIYRLYTPF